MSRRTAGHGGAHEVSATGPRPAPMRRAGALARLLARAFTGGRAAADERLAEAYERFGFTRTRHRRVHTVIP